MSFDPVSYIMGKQAGGGGGGVTVEPLSVTENGTYTAPSGKAYSPVTVDVPPSVNPYYYPPCASVQLPRDAGTIFPSGTELTVDCSKIINIASMARAGYECPGYNVLHLINIDSTMAMDAQYFCSYHRSRTNNPGLTKITLDGDLKIASAKYFLYDNNTLVEITGGAFDFSEASYVNSTTIYGANQPLTTISFVRNSIKVSFQIGTQQYLNAGSLVSIANGLDGSVTGQTLTLHATPKATCQTLMGTVMDGLFTADASGTVTLADFITTVKGWTLA